MYAAYLGRRIYNGQMAMQLQMTDVEYASDSMGKVRSDSRRGMRRSHQSEVAADLAGRA